MNYPEELREKWNECMFDERDIIEKFLKDQYDLRYGHQRDTWHFEPAIEMIARQGSTVSLTDIELNEDSIVNFIVDSHLKKGVILECSDFAYGELSKVIEALPDAEELNERNAEADLLSLASNGTINIDNNPYTFTDAMGNKYDVLSVSKDEEEGGKILYEVHETLADGRDGGFGLWPDVDADVVVGLRDHINIEVLHCSDEYKTLMGLLDNFDNKAFNFVEHNEFPSVNITILGTDMEMSVLDVCKVEDGRLVIYACTDSEEDIHLYDKDIRPEYLVDIIKVVKEHAVYDIMDTYNGHNAELVRKINDAWKNDGYHKLFGTILLALLYRDNMEYEQKFGEILDYSEEYAMEHAHEIMEGVCDDLDLQTILSFIRYEE